MKTTEADRLVLRAASRKVSVQIAAACAAMVAIVVVAAFVFVLRRQQPAEIIKHSARPGRIYIDSNDWLLALVIGGVVGIILAAAVGLFSARRAIKPLADALAAQRRFIQDASHELRSPLAVLDARLQLAARQTVTGSPLANTVAELRRDSAALTETVNDLLLAATQEPSQQVADSVDAAAVITDAVQDMQPLARESGVGLSVLCHGTAPVRIPARTLRRVVVALVDNSLAHTDPGGHIGVTVAVAGDRVRISVADDGAGITGIEPSRIFDRFAHGDRPAEGPARRSYGIGLALVRDAALRHGGDARVTETGPRGTIITVTLPEDTTRRRRKAREG